MLTIIDNTTGCTDSATIDLNYQFTSANANFTSSVDTIICPGQQITYTANNIDTSLYNYSWEIDGISQNSGNNGILSASIYPISSYVTITLFVEDLSNGCIVSNSQYLNAN